MTLRAARRGVVFGAVVAASIAGFTPAFAQTLEENPASLTFGPQVAVLSGMALASNPDDPTPFGIDLAGIAVVDANTHGLAARPRSKVGIDTSLADATAQSGALRIILAKYLGRPLSYQVISQIRADITQYYRDAGRSLVNVTVPPQEITAGVLQVNVNTFVLETTRVEGAPAAATDFLTRQVRLQPGQEVDTDRLLEDVNWLNLNPFRNTSVVFEPGATPASTQLILQVTNSRPWAGFVGVSNSGPPDTGDIRLFGGFNISAPQWQDQQLSYQFTGAPDNLAEFDLWDTGTTKGYLSNSLTYFIPLTFQSGLRTKLTFGASHISSFSVSDAVNQAATETSVANVELAFPLSKTKGSFALQPEFYLQAEYNDYDRTQFFAGLPIAEKTRLWHGVVGLRAGITGTMFSKKSRGNADIGLVFGEQDTTQDLGAAVDGAYSLLKFSVSQEIFLNPDRSVEMRVNGQHAFSSPGPDLHPLAQMALGGEGTVRGYSVNGVASSTALAASLQINFATINFKLGAGAATFRPNTFLDLGFADRTSTTPIARMAAIGIGGEIGIGENLVGSVSLANPLLDAEGTRKGESNIAFQLTSRF